ncbi:hypothetical protein HDU83_001222 [Entophlyctis luteolus]|nr:hypothetical protein HDU83_001222 [Entophlyctis luteolus]
MFSAANIYQPNVYPVNHQFSSDNSRFLNSLPSSAWRGTNFLLSEMYGLGSCSVPVDPNLQNMFCGSEVLNTGVAVPFEASLAVQQSSAAKQSRALVIADSAVQTVCIHTLKSLGMVVDHVASAASFKLRYAINQSNSVAEYDTKHYEIVLLDLDVKWIDAASNKTNTAQMIRTVKCRESSRTKVIAISSVEGLMEDAQQDLQGWLKGLGVAEVLKKPFASENVRMVVGALLGQ